MPTFEELENKRLVKLEILPDQESYNDSYIDTWNETQEVKDKARKETQDQIADEGVWGVVVSYRLSTEAPWRLGDSCWGFVGLPDNDTLREYRATIVAEYMKAETNKCPTCGQERTHA